MSQQDILMYLGIALIVLGALLGGGASYLFFAYNIPDMLDDLSGKKRAEAIARMAEPGTGMLRRSNKAKSSTATPAAQPAAQVPSTGEVRAAQAAKAAAVPSPAAEPAKPAAAPAAMPATKAKKKASKAVGTPSYVPQAEDADATMVIAGEEEATTVISGEEDATTVVGEAPHEQDGASEQPEASRKEAAAEAAAQKTTQAPEEPDVEEPKAAPAPEAPAKPEWFRMVQKIVLTESTDFVKVERGEGHA